MSFGKKLWDGGIVYYDLHLMMTCEKLCVSTSKSASQHENVCRHSWIWKIIGESFS